ncbi:ubiquitin-like FUBI-ribosomal protein eS30 fusion protein [Euwallacea fornicatus]|uniref:ubiquitin-like FUBI-ribosomal protein eS30 fusion protein n=1 Tax=Euwallacea fornicatus TaxID=995702 RepID=UPI00338E59AE
MQLVFRGLSTHVLECLGNESIGQIKERIAALEGLNSALEGSETHARNISLYVSGSPISDTVNVSELEGNDIELTVGLPGGKVHGSLARAGKVKGQTPKVEKQEKKKKKTGRAKRRIQYNRRFVNVVASFGRRRGPNSNSGPAT